MRPSAHRREGGDELASVLADDMQRRPLVAGGEAVEMVERPVEMPEHGPAEVAHGRRAILAMPQQEVACREKIVDGRHGCSTPPDRHRRLFGTPFPARADYPPGEAGCTMSVGDATAPRRRRRRPRRWPPPRDGDASRAPGPRRRRDWCKERSATRSRYFGFGAKLSSNILAIWAAVGACGMRLNSTACAMLWSRCCTGPRRSAAAG